MSIQTELRASTDAQYDAATKLLDVAEGLLHLAQEKGEQDPELGATLVAHAETLMNLSSTMASTARLAGEAAGKSSRLW